MHRVILVKLGDVNFLINFWTKILNDTFIYKNEYINKTKTHENVHNN